MKNSRIYFLAALASFGVYATGNNSLSIDISPEMMEAANKANTALAETLGSEEHSSSRKAATSIAEFSRSEAFREKQMAVKAQVLGTSGLNNTSEEEQGPKLAGNQLVMFVSSSMPLTTLRNYARDLSRVGGVMVMRGTVGGISKMNETISLTRNVLVANPTCEGAKCKMWGTEMLIDPMLFRLYGINKVPALIYQPDMHIQSYCDGLENVNKASAVVYGDASVHSLLERMNMISPDAKVKALVERLEKA
ncbi:conjugal transfer protein TrbC [Escherichia sp. E5028]|uniref:type-F conjugative transfer system pilin assembly protein TrbC n=1 Tax=Escherichia sp. E5028 TaxID=2044602 RepID=UPI00107FB08D|nr:type-F conjugative transfer system pilin assembly protein TrbC [Escherichia sp. E5028]TGB52840.1 conjugal transfer protein TrbC [Escherichia sp. E5028]